MPMTITASAAATMRMTVDVSIWLSPSLALNRQTDCCDKYPIGCERRLLLAKSKMVRGPGSTTVAARSRTWGASVPGPEIEERPEDQHRRDHNQDEKLGHSP